MSSETVDTGRRRFLTATTTVVGGAGVVALAIPFIESWQPSARAQAAGVPVDVDVSQLQPGQKIEVAWRGQPVFVIRRTAAAMAQLSKNDPRLKDPNSDESEQPDYAKNESRSRRGEYLVIVAICTHLGCVPLFVPEMKAQPFDSNWPGGFFCPCHKSRFDMAARVFQNVPAPTNLRVPPHAFSADGNSLTVGVDKV